VARPLHLIVRPHPTTLAKFLDFCVSTHVRPPSLSHALREAHSATLAYFLVVGWLSQSSKRVSPSRASLPGTSVRSLSSAPK
jgi:hypothetical protein